MLLKARLLSGVVTVAGLDEEALLAEGKFDLVVAGGCGVLAGGIAEAVLGAQLFDDLIIDLGYILILLDLEEAAAGLLGHAFKVFLSVDVASGIIAASIAATRISASWVTSARVASAGIAAAGVAATRISTTGVAATVLGAILVGLFAFEVDGVDDGVGALGGFDGFDEGLSTAAVAAVGEDDDGLATGLLAHELVGGEEEGVIENGASAATGAAGCATVVRGSGVSAGGVYLLESGLEQWAGRGQILQELSFGSELNNECLIFRRSQHLIEEGAAGGSFLVDDFSLREACVYQQTEGKGEIGVLVEVANRLRLTVDLKDEVILRKILNERSFFVADDDREVDEAGVDGDGGGGGDRSLVGGGGLLLRGKERRKKNAGQKKRPERAEDDHMELDDIGLTGFQSTLTRQVGCG
jgi:hypothetical protein